MPKLLIADDNPSVRFLIRYLLEKEGFELCAEAEDGTRAIELAKQTLPDLILLDLSMPEPNGLEAATTLKHIMPQVPIILFTLLDDKITKYLGPFVGVDLILSKSEGMSTLVGHIRQLLSVNTNTSQADRTADEPEAMPEQPRVLQY
jgi:DNA-binding NarL/FixJ family response regulator